MTQRLSARVSELLVPVSDAQPCGEDQEYTSEFLQLSKAAQPKPEQQYGSTVIPAQPADWAEVARLGEQMLTRSKDLRVATLLAQAWTEQRGMAGFADGLQLVEGLLARYWDALHPRLENDGDDDPLPRHNALARLFNGQGCVQALRASSLAAAGGLQVREIEQLLEGAAPERIAYPGGRDRLRAAFEHAWNSGDVQLHALPLALQALGEIVRCVHAHLGDEWRPDATALEKLLSRLHETAAETKPAAAPLDPLSEAGGPTASSRETRPMDAVAWHAMNVRCREDIEIVLEKVCHYLEQHEPSHPAPILLRRAMRLMQMSFYEILRDIVPDSLPQVDVFIGKPK